MPTLDQITRDLNWRESELGILKLLLNRPDNSDRQREVLLRAAWALLYAHYEGYSKFCLELYFDELAKRTPNCKGLPVTTRAFALRKKLKEIRCKPELEFLASIEEFETSALNSLPNFPEVDTQSNLWPNVLRDLLVCADLNPEIVSSYEAQLKTLVSRRNEIAHGQKNFISEVAYYITFDEAVRGIMYDLAFAIDERLAQTH